LSHKDNILAVVKGEPVSTIPFGARIDTWYNYHLAHDTLPPKYKGRSETDIIADQGAGAQKRYFSVCKERFHGMEVVIKHDPPYETREYITPIGKCGIKLLWSTSEGPWLAYEQEKLFKSPADYPVIKYIMEHTEPYFDEGYTAVRREVGDRGIVMTGVGLWSPPQRVMREIIGYEQFYMEMMDNQEQVEEMIAAVEQLELKKLEIALDADIEIINLCANWSDDIHTPVFRDYFTPYLQKTSAMIAARGKFSMVHADGEMRRLLPYFPETRVRIAEAITPAPMSSLTMGEFRRGLGEDVVIWGGIPSVMFEPNYSTVEFDDFVISLIKEMAPGGNFIMGMADNLPFDGDIDRVGRVVHLLDKYGRLPAWV
jgi:uroporphyrinogen-III decarboxylase